MRFLPRKHRKPPTVIVVALIDVLMVVLIFMVVSTTFKNRPPCVSLCQSRPRHNGRRR